MNNVKPCRILSSNHRHSLITPVTFKSIHKETDCQESRTQVIISCCIQSSTHQNKSFCKTGYCKNYNQHLKYFSIPFFRAPFFSDEVSNTKIRYSYTQEISDQYVWKLLMKNEQRILSKRQVCTKQYRRQIVEQLSAVRLVHQ